MKFEEGLKQTCEILRLKDWLEDNNGLILIKLDSVYSIVASST